MFLLAALVHSSHLGCSNLLVGAKASGTGSPQIAYTSDAGFQYVCPRLSFLPIRLVCKITYIIATLPLFGV